MATSAHSTASRETVLVTGAASGLGAATATLLATRFNVVVRAAAASLHQRSAMLLQLAECNFTVDRPQ